MRRLYSLYIYAQRTPPATCGPAVESRSARTSSRTMQAGFYTIMAAQFFSSLPANPLLVPPIPLLPDLDSPPWMTSSLQQVLLLSYLLLGLLAIDSPKIDTGIETPPQAAIAVIMGCYAIAAVINWYIPDTGVERRVASKNPMFLIREFAHCNALLWRDKLGQISLATTTLFWGAGATLQFIVIDWAATPLCYNLSRASYLQGVVAIGIALGAALAARFVPLRGAARGLPLGVFMGIGVIWMAGVTTPGWAIIVMTMIGILAGLFVVPMNALLQHRGHVLMGAGHSIAVQNFNENVGVLIMLAFYAVIVHWGLSTNAAIVLFGLFVATAMLLVIWRHRHNLAAGEVVHLASAERAEAKPARP